MTSQTSAEYMTTSEMSQKDIELCTINKINSSIYFEVALFSNNILCCLPDYSSGELLHFMKTKANVYQKIIYNAIITETYGQHIKCDWDTIIQLANKKNVQTAVCCFYHGEDNVFPKFLGHFKGETLILISDTALFEDYYDREFVNEWRFIKDIHIGEYLHMLVFTRHKLDLVTRSM